MTAPAAAAPTVTGAPWLDNKHPIWTAQADLWRQNERRLRGGKLVLDGDLLAFDWEAKGTGAMLYQSRKALAHYENLPEEFATLLVGHLMRSAPQPDHGLSFGALGKVRGRDQVDRPTRAELLWYNADGAGNDGAQWDNYWAREMAFAMATGHRWEFVDAPGIAPRTLQDELTGRRPYLRGFSPLTVTDWYWEGGKLAYAILRLLRRKPLAVQANQSQVPGYLLLVREGFRDLGPEYEAGGWWRFDDRKVMVEAGDWSKTGGEVPLFPLYYQRDNQDGEYDGTTGAAILAPSMSRPGLTELGQLAVALLNITSAQRFDAWDAAKSITWFLGVDQAAFNLAMQKLEDGSRYIPLPQAIGADGTRGGLAVTDSAAGAVASAVFRTILLDLRETAGRTALQEAAGSPGASGLSKEATFSHRIGARLAGIASEMENAQNTALYFAAMRFGVQANGQVVWPRKFDLVTLMDRLLQFFQAQSTAGASSKTATGLAMTKLVGELGITQEDTELATIRSEIEASVSEAQAQRSALRSTLAAMRGGADGKSGDGDGNRPPPRRPQSVSA